MITVWPSRRLTIMNIHHSETPVNKTDIAPALTGQEESPSGKHCYYEGRSESRHSLSAHQVPLAHGLLQQPYAAGGIVAIPILEKR